LSITANRVEVLIAIGVMGKTRGEISEGSVATLFKVVLIVSEGAAVGVVKAKLAKALIL